MPIFTSPLSPYFISPNRARTFLRDSCDLKNKQMFLSFKQEDCLLFLGF